MLYTISSSNLDFKSLRLDQPIESAVDPVAEVEDSSMIVSAEEIREMVYHTSSIGGIVDQAVKNHRYTQGTYLGPEMMAVVSSALNKCSSCFVKNSYSCIRLKLVAKIVSDARMYDNYLKKNVSMEMHRAKKKL
ncbi:MAG: hypothetical protein V4494_04155 [Chlamydiota bacterium]